MAIFKHFFQKFRAQFFHGGAALGLFAMLLYRGGIPFLGVVALTVLGAGLWFFGVVLQAFSARRVARFKALFFGILVGLLLVLWGLSAHFSVAPDFGAEDTLLFVASLFVFFGVLFLKEEVFDAQAWGKILMAGLLVATVPGFYFFSTLAQPRFFGSFGESISSFNAFPNAYADFVLVGAPVLAVALWRASGFKRVLLMALAAFVGAGFVLSLSRGAWIALSLVALAGSGLALGRFLMAKNLAENLKENWRGLGFKLASFGVLVLAVLGLVNALQIWRAQVFEVVTVEEKTELTSDEGHTSTDERIAFWKGSLELFVKRPFLGSGPATFSFVYPSVQQDFGAISGHPHNVFLKFAVEEGGLFAGLAGLLALGFLIFELGSGALRRPLFWGILACFLHNLIDYNLNFSSIVFAMSVGAGLEARNFFYLAGRGETERKERNEQGWFSRANFLRLGALLAVAFMVFSLREAFYKRNFVWGVRELTAQHLESAERYFERAQHVWWPEDLAIQYAQSLGKQGLREEARAILSEAVSRNQTAAFAEAMGLWSSGAEARGMWFERALALDPHNEVRYFYEVAMTKGYDTEKLRELLSLYTGLLAKNFHNTLLSSNPKYVDLSYRWLFKNVQGAEKAAILGEHKKFLEIWAREQAKFEQLFNVQL